MMDTLTDEVASDFAHCASVVANHYENFSVLSFFIPKELRPHFSSIYAYCRGVDDLGDEFQGDRLLALDEWESELVKCYEGTPTRPGFLALQATIQRFGLDKADFLALIEANRMDQRVSHYDTFADLRAYCAASADPVGRLVLQLFGYHDPTRRALSDQICTGLQMANFLQDVSVDIPHGRLYLPLEDLQRFGVSEQDLQDTRFDRRFAELMAFEVERTQRFFDEGKRLETMVTGRLSRQLGMYRLGGQAILDEIKRSAYLPFPRPQVSTLQKGWMAVKLLLHIL